MEPTLVIPAHVKNLAAIRRFVEETASAYGADRETVEDLVLAVDESTTNIVVHGYNGQPGNIEIRITLEEGDLVVRMCDQSPLFDPTQVPLPDLNLPLEQRGPGGLGVYLARKFTDAMTYRVTPEGHNELTLRKKLRAGPGTVI